MNAIISLCHFCEVHGPRVVYSTQPFRPQDPKDVNSEDIGHIYRKSSSISNPDQSGSSSSFSSSKDVCEGCRSAQTDFVSHDVEAKVSYVSTQHINNPEVFTRIRQACIRSLSCEVCPGREGPIFFGDEQCGQVLSYTFYIRDTQARGLNRWYSILVVMMDKIYLLNSWPFLVQNIRLIIDNLQKKAKKVFDVEEAKCPQKLLRMKGLVDPVNFITQRGGGNKTTRSLQELTADKNVFCMLHTSFIWLLRVCGNRTKETLLEGPPTEDSIIDMEKQEETEEGFVMVHTRKVVDGDLEAGELTKTSTDDNESNDIIESKLLQDDSCGPCVKNLRHLKKLLGGANFQTLAHHVAIGNQIIIRGHRIPLVNSIIDLLKCFLPKGSSHHQHLFLVLSPEEDVNDLKISPNHVILDIKLKEECLPPWNSGDLDSSDFSEVEDEDDSSIALDFLFEIHSPHTLPQRVPTVLNRMILTLCNRNLSQEVVESCFTCLKEEWMNKVKVYYTFTRSPVRKSEEEIKKLLQMLGAREEDRGLLEFWMTGLSVQFRTHVMSPSTHR